MALGPRLSGRLPGRATWSPDSLQLAYTVQISTEKIALELVNRDGSNRRRVRHGSDPALESRGRRTAGGSRSASRRPARATSLATYLVNADGSGLRLFAGGETWNPRWSPSGAWILYDRTLHERLRDVDQLVLRHPNGSGTHVF